MHVRAVWAEQEVQVLGLKQRGEPGLNLLPVSVRVLRDPASLTATRTTPSGPTPHELIGATIVRGREICHIRPEIRFIRHGTSPMFPWFILLAVFTLVGSASAETWRELTVAPEQRCSTYDRKRTRTGPHGPVPGGVGPPAR